MRWGWICVLALTICACGGSAKPPQAKEGATPRETPTPRTDAASIAARAKITVLC